MQQQRHPLLSPSLGTQREIISYHYGPANAERQVYIQASLHGDELPGMVAAWVLKHKLQQLEQHGFLQAQITLVPVANPIALNQHWHGSHLGRFETDSGQDFNRRFPSPGAAVAPMVAPDLGADCAANRRVIRRALARYFDQQQPQTELESQRLVLMRMACQADLMLDVHCDWEAVAHLYTTPRAWPAIEPLARYLGSDVQLLADVSGGEPFDESCGEPWRYLQQAFGDRFPMPEGPQPVTLELRGVRDVSLPQAEHDADAIIHAMIHAGYIRGEAPPLPALRHPATPLAGCEYITCPHAGVILHLRELGEWIHPGEAVAEILDPLTDRLTPLVAQYGGLLYARHWMRYATAGMLITRLAGEDAGREGELLVP